MKKTIGMALILFFLFSFHRVLWAAEIHELVKVGDVGKVKTLLEKDPQAKDSRDEMGRTPLHWAARGTNLDIIKLLVEKGVELDVPDNNGIAALHSLAARGNTNGALLILEKGARVDIPQLNQNTPLHTAALNQQIDMIHLLVKHKANLESVNDYLRTPLIMAAREMAGVEVIRTLLDLGAKIDAADRFGSTALLLSAWRGSTDVVNLLLERKATIPINSEKGKMLLQFAVEKGLSNLFSRLVTLGAVLKTSAGNESNLLLAAAEGGAIPIIETLLDKGFDVNRHDRNGWTALHFATDLGRIAAIDLLLAKGADLKARTLMGQTAANIAQDNEDKETLTHLASKGLNVSPPTFPELKGPYLGQKPPGRKAELFAPGIVSVRYGMHSNIVFSPDGSEAFWTVMLPTRVAQYSQDRTLVSHLENGRWTYPRKAVFSGVTLEDVPFFHPAGTSLYDMARRPVPGGEDTGKENIWVWPLSKKEWQKPEPLPGVINQLPHHWQFSVDRQGNLYFSTNIPGSLGGSDIYVSRLVKGEYQKPENLGPQINTTDGEGFPFIFPDGKTLLFGRNFDIYVSFCTPDGKWTKAIPLGSEINTPVMEALPIVSPDGRYLFFSRNQQTYWIDAAIIDELRF